MLILMYVSLPWRSARYYSRVAAHEGFGTDIDAWIVGIAREAMAMIWFAPVVVTLLLLAFIHHPPGKALWDFHRGRPIWSALYSAFVLLWIADEARTMVYCLLRPWHWPTAACSAIMLLCLRVSGQYAFSPATGTDNRV